MRHPQPYITAIFAMLMATVVAGIGMAHLTGAAWTAYATFAGGIVALVCGVGYYWKSDSTARDRIYLSLWGLHFALIGFMLGGILGSLVGGAIDRPIGAPIGYFTTAIPSAIFAAKWGRRRIQREGKTGEGDGQIIR